MKKINFLCETLGFGPEELYALSGNFPRLVKKRFKTKKGSKERRYYLAPDKKLLKVQRAIKQRILCDYEIPTFIMGLGGSASSHVSNAGMHSRNHEIVCLDIVNFYDSVPAEKVSDLFKNFFNYDAECVKLLTSLTTFEDRLWQGLATSSHLAYMCSADFSLILKTYAANQFLCFTQYGDDLFFSASLVDSDSIVSYTVSEAKKCGLEVKRKKIKVDRSGTRKVTGALSGKSITRAPKKLRKKAELLARIYANDTNSPVKERLRGLVLFIQQCNPKDAKRIIEKYKIKF